MENNDKESNAILDADFVQEVYGLAKQIQEISNYAVLNLTPQVDNLISSHCIDNAKIERLLDELFDYLTLTEEL